LQNVGTSPQLLNAICGPLRAASDKAHIQSDQVRIQKWDMLVLSERLWAGSGQAFTPSDELSEPSD